MKKLCQALSITLVATLMSIATASQAIAHHDSQRYERKRLEIFLDDWHLRGASTIYLKKELRRSYPNIDPSNYSLRKVVLSAKSKRGHGSAYLRVGNHYSFEAPINGHPQDFHQAGGFYDRLKFRNPTRNASGPWQLHLQGNIKVDRVVLVVTKRYNSHYTRGAPRHLGQQPAQPQRRKNATHQRYEFNHVYRHQDQTHRGKQYPGENRY